MNETSTNCSWYRGWDREIKYGYCKGKALLEAIDSIQSPSRLNDKTFRIPLQDIYKVCGVVIVPVGHVETGVIKAGMTVTFALDGIVKYWGQVCRDASRPNR